MVGGDLAPFLVEDIHVIQPIPRHTQAKRFLGEAGESLSLLHLT